MADTKVKSDYGVNQIHKLEGLEAVRIRPAMYIGGTSQNGIDQLVYEIIDNSIDEFVAGYGKHIKVHIYSDFSVEVIDNGRGIPVGKSDMFKDSEGNPQDTLTGILTNLHAGGKFGEGGYKCSSGLHGVGSTCVNALSDSFDVVVKRDGHIWHQHFSKGIPTCDVENIGNTTETGTIIKYHPDKTIFKLTLQPSEHIRRRFKELASLNAGLTIEYINDITKEHQSFCFENGISEYTLNMVKDKTRLYDKPICFNSSYTETEHDIICEVSFIHDDDTEPSSQVKTFANNINTYEGGYHLIGFKNAFKDFFNKYGIDKKLIKEPIEMQYYMDGLHATISMKLFNPEFEGQTKTKLGNKEAQDAIQSILTASLISFAKQRGGKEILDAIVNRAIKVKEAELAARKARSLSRQSKKVLKVALPGKLADCSNRNGYNELWVCEGDSAAGSMKEGRDKAYQAVLGLRGKILNVNKADLGKILNSDTIKGIVAAIGGGIGNSFKIDDVRYEKIILACDADVDGSHIRTLVLTLMYYYMNDLLKAGMVYSAQPPLYRIIKKNNESVYLLSDSSLKEYKTKHKTESFKLMRFKGLGEMNPDQLKETTMDIRNRTLRRITMEEAKDVAELFDTLMGKDVDKRKQFIEANSDMVDLDSI